MRKISLTLTLILLASVYTFAQDLYYQTYNWGSPISNYTDTLNAHVLIKENKTIEYTFENNVFIEYQLYHTIEWLNSEAEIENNNKKFINLNAGYELVSANARVIKGNQTKFELSKDQILSSIDEKTGRTHNYFALDGLEKGSIVEILYVIKKYPSYNGRVVDFQEDYPISAYEFNLIAPKYLIFNLAVYNDSNQVILDTTVHDKNFWSLKVSQIAELKDEDQAPYTKLLKQVWYKLDKNLANNGKDITSYGDASQNVYKNMFVLEDKKALKAVQNFIDDIDFKVEATPEDKIIEVENYLKANINIITSYGDEYEDLSWIIKNKTASENGMVKLFVQAFKYLNINFQLVLTNDRTESFFNTEFESYNCLTDYLIYFPGEKKYLAPQNFIFRYPLVPYGLTDNSGLFIKETTLGEFTTGIGKVNYINTPGYNASANNMHVKVNFSNNFDNANLNVEILSSGYYGVYSQAYYSLLNQTDKDDMIKESLENYMKELKADSVEIINGDINLVGKKPYIVKVIGTNPHLIETASNKFLFKVGDLIGPQVEMYSESERTLPVWDTYKRSFIRHIEIEIPEGYTVKNLSDLAINENYIKSNKKVLTFESTYKTENNLIIIDIEEYYDQLYFELNEYEYYRKVVNSAADFNKVVLIFEKKEISN